jgi:hypothetical protein
MQTDVSYTVGPPFPPHLLDRMELVVRGSFEGLREAYRESVHCEEYGYFIKDSIGYSWILDHPQNPLFKIRCEDVLSTYSGKGKSVLLVSYENVPVKQEDCLALEKEIIAFYALDAVQGNLSETDAYSTHLAYQCDEKDCFEIGDLLSIRKQRKKRREELIEAPITVCPKVVIRKTRLSNNDYQTLSAIIFGKIPETIGNICMVIFERAIKKHSSPLGNCKINY